MMWEDVHDMLHVGSMVKLYTNIMPIIFFKVQEKKILWVILFPSLQLFFFFFLTKQQLSLKSICYRSPKTVQWGKNRWYTESNKHMKRCSILFIIQGNAKQNHMTTFHPQKIIKDSNKYCQEGEEAATHTLLERI